MEVQLTRRPALRFCIMASLSLVAGSAEKPTLTEQNSIDTFTLTRYYFQATGPAVRSGHHPFNAFYKGDRHEQIFDR
jgi:hypothetical protein